MSVSTSPASHAWSPALDEARHQGWLPESFAIRPGAARGRTRIGWLDSFHSFSFGRYIDRSNMGFRALRVINDDRILPGTGFGEHPHDNMEILTWVLSGAVRHGDSLANSQRLVPGELQAMSAGSGIRHSEFNDSQTEPLHLLQIWLGPAERDTEPRYAQQNFPEAARTNQWQPLTAPGSDPGPRKGRPSARGESSGEHSGEAGVVKNDTRDSRDVPPMPIGQDAHLSVANVDAGQSVPLHVRAGRHAYVHVASGRVALAPLPTETTPDQAPAQANGSPLVFTAGDAFTLAGPASLQLVGQAETPVENDSAETLPNQVLWFDLA